MSRVSVLVSYGDARAEMRFRHQADAHTLWAEPLTRKGCAGLGCVGADAARRMVTAEDIGRITIFSVLDQGAREQLARAAGDITLQAGEYAAQERDERALFGLLEGRIEAVKNVDGIPQVVGQRNVGDIFGEVPVTLGTVFPVGFRAAEGSRVMRIEANDYHAVAALEPDV